MTRTLTQKERLRRKVARHTQGVVEAIRELTGIDDARADLLDLQATPGRVARMVIDDLHTAEPVPAQHLKTTEVALNEADMVAVGPIDFASTCAHHMLPFYGHMWVAYLHGGRLLGLSKFTRIIHHMSKRLQLQELLTRDVSNLLLSVLKPRSLLVVSKAAHGCVSCRGVRDSDQRTTCAALDVSKEVGADRQQLVDEMYRLIGPIP